MSVEQPNIPNLVLEPGVPLSPCGVSEVSVSDTRSNTPNVKHTERRVQALPWASSGVRDASFRRSRTQLWPNQYPSRAPGVTPNAREFLSSSGLQGGQLGVATTVPNSLILASGADACLHSHTKKAAAAAVAPPRTRPARLPHAR